ncbi:hypothetical protein [Ruminococcus sp.]|uniref:hypothetical protein n=1 Tax=Ruminococcus sp. TaxID=41978 RepID=UPI0025D87071|nr:hypothetical protein [Ruminococcus sp.]MBQ9541091.1 hypothetical protein [Ruminococcus sp.]
MNTKEQPFCIISNTYQNWEFAEDALSEFGEKLISMGFNFIGGRSFVRVINDEVIQTVSCVKGIQLGAYGLDEGSDVIYRIWFAISTVYDDEMLFKPNRCQTGFETFNSYMTTPLAHHLKILL